MKLVKAYCGKAIYRMKNVYLCIDMYTEKVECVGTLKNCNECLKAYIEKINER